MNVNGTEITVGTKLYGFCGGAFGRDYYHDVGVVESAGKDWLIVRAGGVAYFACDDPRPGGWTVAGLIEFSKALQEGAR